MKLIRFIFVAILVLLANRVEAQTTGSIELEQVVAGGVFTPQVNVYAKGPIRGKLGWTLWAQSSQVWGETLGGLTFAPTKWIEVAGMVGLETYQDPVRFSGTAWIGKGRFSLLSIQEKGGSGYWQKNVAIVQLDPTFAIGLLQQTDVGVGPYIEAKSRRLTLWGAFTLDKPGMMTGIRVGF